MTESVSKSCELCGKPFTVTPRLPRQRFCTPTCRNESYRAKRIMRETSDATSKSSSGAASELFVCADLMWRGYEVFRAQSPHCSCDLIAMRDGNILRVEVKTGYYNQNGVVCISYPDPERYDVLAVVLPDNVIRYSNESGDWQP